MASDLYALLGVAPDADEDQLRRAWRATAKATHPDLHPGDTDAAERFKAAAAAWEVLSSPDARRAYDEQRAAPPPPPPPPPRPPPAAGQPWEGVRASGAVRCLGGCGSLASASGGWCEPCARRKRDRVAEIERQSALARQQRPLTKAAVRRRRDDERRFGAYGWWGPDGLPRWG